MFDKILVANRGEIAVRIIRTLHEMGITSVAIHSDADRNAHHVRVADEAFRVGPAPSAESYLRIDRIIEIARETGARAIHPGYGFLAENAGFAAACEKAGLAFIGPPASVIAALGDKVEARRIAERAGAPTVPGSEPLPDDPKAAEKVARTIGYPVILKAAGGGGGKGMRIVGGRKELASSLALTRGEAQAAFSNPDIYVERYIENPRHVEVQILADANGNAVWLGERECSIQRRHQKLIEETPSPAVDEALRARMGEAAVAVATEAGYIGAGTVEFLLAPDGTFYFLEVNARLQVEHPVTEWVTGLDLVREMIEIAAGRRLELTQDRVPRSGSAIECRICTEDSALNFAPSTGAVTDLRLPEGPFVRSDFGLLPGSEVSVHYDPLVGKIIAWGRTREEARIRLVRAVDEFRLSGVITNQPFHAWALAHPAFIAGDTDTGFIDRHFRPEELAEDASLVRAALLAAAVQAYDDRRKLREPQDGRPLSTWRRGTARWSRGGSRWR
jgi:acetyl-CoA carboxylase biotin carboxylase subunit